LEPSMGAFYLTNCNYLTNGIPASFGRDQLNAIGNKALVAGYLRLPNTHPDRVRGDIRMSIDQAHTSPGSHQYSVTYFDQFLPPMGGEWQSIHAF
jgi:hypothetical protein